MLARSPVGTSWVTNSLKMSLSKGTPSRAQAHLTSSTKSIPSSSKGQKFAAPALIDCL